MQRLRQQAQALVQNVLCGVYVSVVDCAANRTNPLPDGQILCAGPLGATSGTKLTGWIETVYRYYLLAVPRRFVLQLPTELTPACVGD